MPKMKTRRTAAKRFSRTGTGKIKRFKAFASHLMSKKSRKRKRNFRRSALVHKANLNLIKPLIPYK